MDGRADDGDKGGEHGTGEAIPPVQSDAGTSAADLEPVTPDVAGGGSALDAGGAAGTAEVGEPVPDTPAAAVPAAPAAPVRSAPARRVEDGDLGVPAIWDEPEAPPARAGQKPAGRPPRAAPEAEEPKRKGMFGVTPGRAAAGLTAAAAAAYAVYLLGAGRGRRRPVTELANALGMRLDYVPWGDVHYAFYAREGHGRPIVLLHSINAVASAHEMRPLARAFLRDRDRPVYALEWLGFGHSDRPEIEYTPDVLEDQLEHWLERVIRPAGGADVIGLSLGATYAAEVARRRPDLVRSLVAIEPSGLGDEPAEIGRGWARLLFTLPGVQRAFYERLTTPEALSKFARQHLFTPDFGVPDEYVNFAVETARVEGAAHPLDDFLSGRMAPDEALETFRRLRQPLLVIHGTVQNRRMENYTSLPELDERPNVKVVALPTGSMPHWEHAREVVQRIRDFHDSLEGQRRAE
ncbi:MAG TPA: alpha/beta fold hydrolase [Longimicrobium sp.]|nr:alpha/beta fold hydrolase [Longimicrobium sp.]